MQVKEPLVETGTTYTDAKYWHGYLICSDGTIFNKDGSIKKLNINPKGYYTSNFYYNRRLNCHLAHTVVWRGLMGDIPPGYEVDHIDNNRLNNKLSNLQLLTKSQNNQKSYDSGSRMFIFGQTNPNSLTRKNNGRN